MAFNDPPSPLIHRLQIASYITLFILVVIALVQLVLVLNLVSENQRNTQKIIDRGATSVYEHRLASRCFEAELEHWIRTVNARFRIPYTPLIPEVNIRGINCERELAGHIFAPMPAEGQ